jgi:hypothetical protein
MSNKQKELLEYLNIIKNKPKKTKRTATTLPENEKKEIALKKARINKVFHRNISKTINLAKEIASEINGNEREEDFTILGNNSEFDENEFADNNISNEGINTIDQRDENLREENFQILAEFQNNNNNNNNEDINNNNNNNNDAEYVELDISVDPISKLSHKIGFLNAFGSTSAKIEIANLLNNTSFPSDDPLAEFFELNDKKKHPKIYKVLETGKFVWLHPKIVHIFQSHSPRSFNLKGTNFWEYVNHADGIIKMKLGTKNAQKEFFSKMNTKGRMNPNNVEYTFKQFNKEKIQWTPKCYKHYFCTCNIRDIIFLDETVVYCPKCGTKIMEVNCVVSWDLREQLVMILSNPVLYKMLMKQMNENRKKTTIPNLQTKIGDIKTAFMYQSMINNDIFHVKFGELVLTFTAFVDHTDFWKMSKNKDVLFFKVVINELDGDVRFKHVITMFSYQERIILQNDKLFVPLICHLQFLFNIAHKLTFYHYIWINGKFEAVPTTITFRGLVICFIIDKASAGLVLAMVSHAGYNGMLELFGCWI